MDARAHLFAELYGAEDTIVVKTAEDAILALKTYKFDLVSLDHDLGGRVYQPSNSEDCGMEVVRWIVEHLPPIDCIIVHSWNIPASIRMADKLYRAGYDVKRMPLGFGQTSFQRGRSTQER